MAKYLIEYSNFPESPIEPTSYKNVNSTVADLVNSINGYRLEGDYATAQAILDANAKNLKPYIIDASTINRIIEEIYNTQLYALQVQQTIYTGEEMPINPAAGDVWVGGGKS